MNHDALVSLLMQADEDERWALLNRNESLIDVQLARSLKRLYDDTESSDPTLAASAASILISVSEMNNDLEIAALTHWTVGMATIDNGQMEEAIVHLNTAYARFIAINQPHAAAATQVSKLIALAMLGRYDEALACGVQTRDQFLSLDDILAAGKIEQNLGNIFHRRGDYLKAEELLRSAWTYFDAVADQKQLAQVENCLGVELMFQHRFRDAEMLYEQALQRAEAAGLTLTQAEIECNLGNLALFQGRYGRSLDYLERSRRRYAVLHMPHELAIAELELADAYLELNLLHEAGSIYQRVAPTFEQLGMSAELAHALAQQGRVSLLNGQIDKASDLLVRARDLYSEEGNAIGAATVSLTEAHIHYAQGHYNTALAAATLIETSFESVGNWSRLLMARWLQGEVLRALKQYKRAQLLLHATLDDAEHYMLPQIVQRCYTSLGLLAMSQGYLSRAEDFFEQAIIVIEHLRAPLPSSEFRAEFIVDKLIPYRELVRLCLADTTRRERVIAALEYTELARARTLVDAMSGSFFDDHKPQDSFEANLITHVEKLRSELNWLYNQINQASHSGDPEFQTAVQAWHNAAREHESALLIALRQLKQHGNTSVYGASAWLFDIAQLQRDIGEDTAVIEYFCLDGDLLAFVITNNTVEVFQHLASEAEVQAALHNLNAQMGALRYHLSWSSSQIGQLKQRTRRHLHELYHLLLHPLESWIRKHRIVIVPYGTLHYVPFHALYDGEQYLIERYEVLYAPSAAVLQNCLNRPQKVIQQPLLIGVSDFQVPKVRDEIDAIAALFPDVTVLVDEQATLSALQEHAPHADVLHLACHGQFRPDSPLFSSLRLANGWLTVHDAASLHLNCALVVLSACETGKNAVMPGDELVGLAGSFFSAGTTALLVSLWAVDDETTAKFMSLFYTHLQRGDSPAAALRATQCAFLQEDLHPFFWSPFTLIGRW